jgi:hypothetical protein
MSEFMRMGPAAEIADQAQAVPGLTARVAALELQIASVAERLDKVLDSLPSRRKGGAP